MFLEMSSISLNFTFGCFALFCRKHETELEENAGIKPVPLSKVENPLEELYSVHHANGKCRQKEVVVRKFNVSLPPPCAYSN